MINFWSFFSPTKTLNVLSHKLMINFSMQTVGARICVMFLCVEQATKKLQFYVKANAKSNLTPKQTFNGLFTVSFLVKLLEF